MDASASPEVDADFNHIYGFFLEIGNNTFPTSTNQNNTVIKYTKLPKYEFNSKVSWPPNSYVLHPRFRRIIAVDDDDVLISHSLPHNLTVPSKTMRSGITKRKIVTISEDDENDLHPRFYKDSKRPNSVKTSNRSVEANIKVDKQHTQRTNTRLVNIQKNTKDQNSNAKINNMLLKKDLNLSKINSRSKCSNIDKLERNDNKNLKQKELSWHAKHTNLPSKTTITSNSKNSMYAAESEKEMKVTKYKLNEQNIKNNTLTKKLSEKARINKLPTSQIKSKETFFKDAHANKQSYIVIHVPLDNKFAKQELIDEVCSKKPQEPREDIFDCVIKTNQETDTEKKFNLKEESTETYPVTKSDKATEVNQYDNTLCKCMQNTDVQTEVFRGTFDSLDIPNVTLKKDKNELADLQSKSLPNLKIPFLNTIPDKDEKHNDISNSICKNTSSYIIRRATVTYTTKQEINFHVVDSNSDTVSNKCPSPLSYPFNVVSVYRNEINKNNSKHIAESNDLFSKKYTSECIKENYLEELNPVTSYVFDSNKLMKPSDIISTIKVNNGVLQSETFCEQFQRELNFIDSFFESLQYLESSSVTDKCSPGIKVNNYIANSSLLGTDTDDNNSEYGNLLSKLENGASVGDTETMASKSLCLLNLLIQDEQRRAKNLLFVLKMREDALKDFTKSQILWLENKKKHDNNNTAISTLKKKQRGALLKLQHECGEMQRMRKALLTLSEKRKLALMKTKKNIELKLNNNINVEQILLGKKKLRRNTDHSTDRNIAPLKCFDLSSSGCEEYTTSRQNSDTCKQITKVNVTNSNTPVTSAEKCIQTGDDSIVGSLLFDTPNTAAENFVAVDGGYLNILFHNLSLPQIFSSGKQYEVNEEELKNIVNSTNSSLSDFNDAEVIDKLMDQIKNRELDRSSSPSTARSLVDEFDQYYKVLTEEEKSSVFANVCANFDYNPSGVVCEIKDSLVQATESKYHLNRTADVSNEFSLKKENINLASDNLHNADQSCECEPSLSISNPKNIELDRNVPTGPLPVPPGEAAVTDSRASDVPAWPSPTSSSTSNGSDTCSFSSQPLCGSIQSSLTLPSSVHSEAEELRRQQLAIEREIKVLEQQQCRLLVVREIPDKPPPPYTPPSDSRVKKSPQKFNVDEMTNDRIYKFIADPSNANIEPTDAFDIFLQDFCQESVKKQRLEQSDKPWDACNLLPQKTSLNTDQIVNNTSSQLLEVLTGVAPVVVSSVGARRSDHIDDILFSEWRRCEPEWTNLHNDEAVVKNQVFESIFQKILSETIDEYKRIVNNKNTVTE